MGHLRDSGLVQQVLPPGIVVLGTPQILEHEPVLGTGHGHLGIRVEVGRRVEVGVDVELGCPGFLERCRGRRRQRGLVVGEAVGAGEVDHVASSVREPVLRSHGVAGARVVCSVDDGVLDRVGLLGQHRVAVRIRGKDVVPSLEDVAAGTRHVVGREVLDVHLDGHVLGGTGLQHACLGEAHKVRGGLLHTAVRVGRVAVELDNLLACGLPRVGHADLGGDPPVSHRQRCHRLLERGVAQTMAEGVLDHLVVRNGTLCGGGLVVLVADVDALGVVDERRREHLT